MNVSEELRQRGFIHQYSAKTLEEIVDGPKRVVYHGIDPTADSAHAGNFVNWLLLLHLARAGHKIVFLVGGGTGMIGDPKPDVERALTPPDVVAGRVEKLRAQAQRLFGGIEVEFVNNHDWLSKLDLIGFLRDTGKHFTVNELIKKDAIATRLSSDNGISYTEFAYPLLQAYDFFMLNERYGSDLQVGGSDQWGNIISGVELIRRKKGQTVYALTVPLVVDKTTGKKFGKSEGNAVWLDAEKTSPYHFYQFWLNVSDDNVIDYLKLFTFLPLEEIAAIEAQQRERPSERTAQHVLAKEVTSLVHGSETAESAFKISSVIFGQFPLGILNEIEKHQMFLYGPVYSVDQNVSLVDALVVSELATSKREARTFIAEGAVAIDGDTIQDAEYKIQAGSGSLLLLKRGKQKRIILNIK